MTAADHRKGPRRRGDALVNAILSAALDELQEHGYAGVTMDAVAQRASASKASLYRRWDTRTALVMEAVHRLTPAPDEIPDTGTLRGDLLAVVRQTAAALQGPAGAALRGMLAEALPEPHGVQELRARSRGRNRQMMVEVLRRAVARDEIPAGAVVDSRLEVGAALLRNQFLFQDAAFDDPVLVSIVDDILVPLFHTEP